jgi:hypothetical protein
MVDRQGINAVSKKALSHNTTRLKKKNFHFCNVDFTDYQLACIFLIR